MIDINTKFEIIFQKSVNIEAKRQRGFLILILLPILYVLLKTSIIQEINFTIFSIKQIKVLLLFFPTLYAALCFYLIILTNHNSKIIDELNFIATEEKETSKQYKKESWLKIIQPLNIMGIILGSIRAGGLIGCLGSIIVFIPLLFFAISYPISFMVYFLYCNTISFHNDINYFAVGNFILSLWIIIAMIIYSKSAK